MSQLPEQIENVIRERNLLHQGQKILVAVSGGVDSMVLLELLCELAPRHRWRLTLAHLNHGLRGRNSDADQRLVERAARRLGLPVVIERGRVRELARLEKLSVEMAARKLRHAFLARAAAQLKIPSAALAHHADDQVELFFLRLLRGSGGEGLAGMKWTNPSPANPRLQLVRPLLGLPKSALLQFAAARKISFREDATNQSPDIQRNRIRHQLLPLLRSEYQPALNEVILRTIDIVGAESDFALQAATERLESGGAGRPIGDPFLTLPAAVQRRLLQLQLVRAGLAPDFVLVEKLRAHPERPVSVSGGRRIACDRTGRLSVHGPDPAPGFRDPGQGARVELKGGGQFTFAGTRLCWKVVNKRRRRGGVSQPNREFFDADKIGPSVTLRHWQPGDRFQPIGMGAPVKLQDLFVNRKIPRAHRHRLIVAATAADELFWVEKLRISERFKLTPGTRRRLEWRWQKEAE